MQPLAGWIVGDDGQCSTTLEEVPQAIAVVACIGKTGVRRWQWRKQPVRRPVIADLSAGDGERDQPANGIGYGVDFGPGAAS